MCHMQQNQFQPTSGDGWWWCRWWTNGWVKEYHPNQRNTAELMRTCVLCGDDIRAGLEFIINIHLADLRGEV
jgi:hypothetical protein